MLSWFGFVFLCLQSLLSRLLHHRQLLMEKIIGDKKTVVTPSIKIINITNCRREKGETRIWSVWFLWWHEVTHPTTSIIKIIYSNWRPQIKNLHIFHGLLQMKDVHTHRGSFEITVGILLFHIWVNVKMFLFLPAVSWILLWTECLLHVVRQ